MPFKQLGQDQDINTWNDQLHLLISNIEYGQRCLNYKECTLWNNLPRTLQDNANTHQFKKPIKNHLIDIW